MPFSSLFHISGADCADVLEQIHWQNLYVSYFSSCWKSHFWGSSWFPPSFCWESTSKKPSPGSACVVVWFFDPEKTPQQKPLICSTCPLKIQTPRANNEQKHSKRLSSLVLLLLLFLFVFLLSLLWSSSSLSQLLFFFRKEQAKGAAGWPRWHGSYLWGADVVWWRWVEIVEILGSQGMGRHWIFKFLGLGDQLFHYCWASISSCWVMSMMDGFTKQGIYWLNCELQTNHNGFWDYEDVGQTRLLCCMLSYHIMTEVTRFLARKRASWASKLITFQKGQSWIVVLHDIENHDFCVRWVRFWDVKDSRNAILRKKNG